MVLEYIFPIRTPIQYNLVILKSTLSVLSSIGKRQISKKFKLKCINSLIVIFPAFQEIFLKQKLRLIRVEA
jgi:hypothetical protein